MNYNQENLIKEFITEVVKKCDLNKWCLYTAKKDKKSGKRRRLGTHSSKKDAYAQEYAIKLNQ